MSSFLSSWLEEGTRIHGKFGTLSPIPETFCKSLRRYPLGVGSGIVWQLLSVVKRVSIGGSCDSDHECNPPGINFHHKGQSIYILSPGRHPTLGSAFRLPTGKGQRSQRFWWGFVLALFGRQEQEVRRLLVVVWEVR